MTLLRGILSGGFVLCLVLMVTSCDDKPELVPNSTDNGDGEGDGEGGGGDTTPDETLEDITVLADKTYIWDIEDMDWSVPRGAGPEFGQYVPNIIVQITAVDDSGALTLFAGTAGGGEQDMCALTTTLEGSISENPYFETTPVDFVTYGENPSSDIKQVAATLYDMSLGGRFSADGTSIDRGTFSATIDFRELYQLFHLLDDPTPDRICDMVPDYNATCTACPSDGEPYCLELGAELIEVDEATGLTVQEVTATCK